MKVLNLDGLTYYNENLLDKVDTMINDSVSDCVNTISTTGSTITVTKKDGSNENISLTISEADTVDGCHANEFQKVMIPLDNNTNVLEYAENYPVTQSNGTFFTYRVYNGYNEPYSDSAVGSGDYYYYANKLDEKWITLIAVDVRSSNMFMRTRNDGTWGLWRNISNEGIANTAKKAHNAVFVIPNNGTSDVEGGELQLTNQDGTVWNIDSNSNDFRIFDSNGKVHLHLRRDSNDTFIGSADMVDGYHADSFAKLSGAQFTGTVTIQSGELNGAYNGLLIGDDCYIGDCNISNTIGLMGKTDNNLAYVKFGKNGGSLGYNGSNLVYNGSVVVTENNGTASNADKLDGYHASSFPKLEYKSNTNWDTLVEAGMYRLDNIESQSNYINGMTSYGQLLVVRGASDTIAQIYFNYTDNNIFSRSANGVGGTVNWTAWHRLYSSVNMTYGTNALTAGSSGLATGNFYFQYE